jgi:tripartite-type tricarboxylate transporter receptor subunit TctC
MRKPLRAWSVVCVLLAAPATAPAQTPSSYPDRPIRLVVAFVAGGATDTLARQISNDLKEALGQPVVVENRPGANGYLAWNHVAGSEPDGYTLLLAESALGISQALHKKATSTFDPLTQYDAVAAIATSPSALVVANNVPATTVAELVALSRTVSQKMNYASAGVGSVSHLSFEVFKDGVGMEAIHIPYKGGGQAIGDVIAGHVPMAMASVQVAKSLVEDRRIKALGVTGPVPGPARRADPHGGGHEACGSRARILVWCLRPQGDAERRQGQAGTGRGNRRVRPARARAPGQARHHARLRACTGAADQARKRNQELDGVHRQPWDQAGMTDGAQQARSRRERRR